MGIDVGADRIVRYNPGHQQRVVTDPGRKPPQFNVNGLRVVSIFRRQTVKHDSTDGNPLINALKGRQDFTLPYGDFCSIFRCAQAILPAALGLVTFDVIAPLPSSSKVAAIFAKRASRTCGGCPIVSAFDKATFGEVLASAPHPSDVDKRDRQHFTGELHRLQSSEAEHVFEMKRVTKRLRHYFTPLKANAQAVTLAGTHVLLVDDILGSGTSLTAAAKALTPYGPASISGLTFLGRL